MTADTEPSGQPDGNHSAHERQVELLETVGRLAGGIAHDFNNLLASIRGYAELLEMQLQKRGAESELRDLAEITTAAKRANEQTDRLLAFAQRLPTRPRAVDPKDSVAAVERLLKKLAPANVQFSVAHVSTGEKIEVDVSQFERMMMYLAVAAFDTMPNGGECALSTQWRDVSVEGYPAGISICDSKLAGRALEIRVSDTRASASEAEIRNSFMPYANAIEGEEIGRGLGLPAVYGITRKLGGAIVVSTDNGSTSSVARTTVHVIIPTSQTSTPRA